MIVRLIPALQDFVGTLNVGRPGALPGAREGPGRPGVQLDVLQDREGSPAALARALARERGLGMGEEHWHFWLFYVNPDDARILVPKRHEWMGWTLNFAHREAYVVTAGLLGIAAVAVLRKRFRAKPKSP